MMQIPNSLCAVGAHGWDHADWVGAFYPDDLPAEWRLGYYSHTFTCCYLDYADWAQQDEATLAQWVDDTLPRFRLVLQAPVAALSAQDAARLAILAPRLGLLVDATQPSAQILWLADEPDWRQLAAQLQARAAQGLTSYVLSRESRLSPLQQAVTLLDVLGY